MEICMKLNAIFHAGGRECAMLGRFAHGRQGGGWLYDRMRMLNVISTNIASLYSSSRASFATYFLTKNL
jgi:hypothetical protein